MREVPGAMLTGEVTGTVAALSIGNNEDPHDLDTKGLQEKLMENGALAPKFRAECHQRTRLDDLKYKKGI